MTKADIEAIARHYENFPVASILLPKPLREATKIIYAFARTADDIADDPDLDADTKRLMLDRYSAHLSSGKSDTWPFMAAVRDVIDTHQLDIQLFENLLVAFRQDARISTHANWKSLIDYSVHSANPVGRILLQLMNLREERLYDLSDRICTGLQLINFWQDISVDHAMGRYYLPAEMLMENGLTLADFFNETPDDRHRSVLNELHQRTEQIYRSGYPLIDALSGRFRLEIKAIWWSAWILFKRVRDQGTNAIHSRTTVRAGDKISILWAVMFRTLH